MFLKSNQILSTHCPILYADVSVSRGLAGSGDSINMFSGTVKIFPDIYVTVLFPIMLHSSYFHSNCQLFLQ